MPQHSQFLCTYLHPAGDETSPLQFLKGNCRILQHAPYMLIKLHPKIGETP